MTHPTLLKILKCESKVEMMEKGVRVHFLACGTSRVEGRAGAPGWELI
jgi:hypothetical protein